MRDASDSSDWITVERSKNKKKVGTFREISNSNRVLNVSFSNSKNAMMNQVVAPKVQASSIANSTNRPVTFKHKDKNYAKKSLVQVKQSKNSLEKSYEAFSEDLKKVVENHELLQGSLEKIDTDMQKIKKELRDNADLLLLHKGLVMRLKQFQVDRHPILSKTKNFDKIEQRYNDYLKAVDTYRDMIGKLKLYSVKFKEQLGNWKQETRKSTYLLNDIITEELIENVDDQDDCIAASSNASVFSDYECQENPRDWIEHHKCRFVHDERKPPVKLRYPVCPIQHPKRIFKEHHHRQQREHPMVTPMINENSNLTKKIKELQLEVEQNQTRKQVVDEKIINLQDELTYLKQNDAHYDTVGECQEELSSMITEGAWIEKKLIQLSRKIDNLRKRQGFTKVARAFMTTTMRSRIRLLTIHLIIFCTTTIRNYRKIIGNFKLLLLNCRKNWQRLRLNLLKFISIWIILIRPLITVQGIHLNLFMLPHPFGSLIPLLLFNKFEIYYLQLQFHPSLMK